MEGNDDLVREFLIESYEYLDALDEDLMSLEASPDSPYLLASIFRALHTIKGTGGFLDFTHLVAIAHAGESLLDCLRSGEITANSAVINTLLELVDAIREVLREIESTGRDGVKLYEELIQSLNALQAGSAPLEAQLDLGCTTTSIDTPPAATPSEPPAEEPAPLDTDQDQMAQLEDDVKEFLVECYEYLEAMEGQLASNSFTPELAGKMIGATQAMINSGNFLSYFELAKLLHLFKKRLQKIEQGELEASPDVQQSLRAYPLIVGRILSEIKKTGKEGVDDYVSMVENLYAPDDVAPPAPEQPVLVKVEAPQPVRDEQPVVDPGPENRVDDSSGAVDRSADASAGKDGAKALRKEDTIRVNVDLLDNLMNLVGELVLARNQILQFTSSDSDVALTKSSHNLNLITTELQEGVMKTRMQTLSTIWKKFPRIVRDLANSCNKEAEVEMEGADTELDKTIIEAIKDPLTHLIRNAVDHGIETPEERIRLGKAPVGRLRLHAFHEGGRVNIEISDDGGGIDPEKVKKKALETGLISQAGASRMTDRDIINLIFTPGLSTARQLSNISGRGVGMDVVKTYIERIGGTIDVASKPGQGTTIRIKIPLTLAIIPALMVKVRGERFALPQVNLLELVRLEGDQIETHIEVIQNTQVYRLRGELLPLVNLARELGLHDHEKEADEPDRSDLEVINIVVLQAEDRQFGLIVNEVVDTEEVVVKPLSKLIKHISTLAGATIMGDGKVALILDVVGLARKGNVMSEEHLQSSKNDHIDVIADISPTSLLVSRVGEDRQIAIPLSMISRLEEIEATSIEHVGHQEVVQYRQRLMPLVRVDQTLRIAPGQSMDDDSLLQVVVCTKNDVNIGLVVHEIVDVVDESVSKKDRTGITQSVAIIQGKATELLNIKEIIDEIDISMFEKHDQAA